MTQSVYSANSKGDYAPLKAIELDINGRRVYTHWRKMERVKSGESVCRIRIYAANECHKADSVVLISDKPTKSLPIRWDLKSEDVAI